MNILVTGSNGYIARNIINQFEEFNITKINRQNLDLLDSNAVNNFFVDKYFDVIIHTAVSGGSRLKVDNPSCLLENLIMHQNLMKNKKNFNKFIHFGSGAELDRSKQINQHSTLSMSFPTDPYGLSKNIIAKLELNNPNFYNIRIYNVFNYDELSTRMIKSNIINYICKKSIIIHQNKFMDFFYMDDLISVIKSIIYDELKVNTINCSYDKRYCLYNIAKLINNLDEYEVEIINQNQTCMGNSYFGKHNIPNSIKLIGFDMGLKNTYEKIKEGMK